jgi:hypothetical protein
MTLPLAGYRVLGLGEHTDVVLAELGVPPADIVALRAAGVVK